MKKLALITGATDGIGKATAIELAKNAYTIHIIGRNKEKGKLVLEELNRLNANSEHQFFDLDLSSKNKVIAFLKNYTKNNNKLDVLVLNAGSFPKKTSLSEDGVDFAFSVGYVSRYLFSVYLNPLLSKSELAKVIHINGSVIGRIRYKQLSSPKYSKLHSVWQNSVGSALLVYHWINLSKTNVNHIHWNPGIVNTNTVKNQGYIVRKLSALMGMIEADEAGKMLISQIENENSSISPFFIKGKAQKPKPWIVNSYKEMKELILFSEQFTGVKI
jgi:short-subunit dehydrogenase